MHHFYWTMLFIGSVCSAGQITLAQEVRPQSDARALHQLFGETQLAANARQICRAARQQSHEAGFELLSKWVLPGESHPEIRMTGDFRTTEMPPADAIDRDSPWGHPDNKAVVGRLLQRRAVESPVLQLIEFARTTGKLDELQERIDSIVAADSESERAKLTLQFLIQIARQDHAAARATFGEFVETSAGADRSKLSTRWSDFLVYWAGMHLPEIRTMAGTYYFDLYHDPVDASADSQLEVVTDYIRALHGIYRYLELHEAAEPPVNGRDARSQWVPYRLATCASRGSGKPFASWETAHGRAFRLTGHETDFLSFRVPLRGNFQVECDAHPSLSRSLSLMVAGTYAAMNNDSHIVVVGTFGSEPRTVAVEPRFSMFREVVRLRATVRDGVLTHYINGRKVLTRQLPPNHDPWVAIRTGDRSLGVITDLRITGDPIVPTQIDLLVSPELEGWAAYHTGRMSEWEVLQHAAGELELHSARRPDLAGSFAENLLSYHRPLVEDGTIEYDFFYSPGKSCVHPALDRLAFLLTPDGISLHRITDGQYNRTELAPDNETPVRKTHSESQPLPLVENDWNRLKLTITGDELELFLNGRSIHKQTLDAGNRRTFGLFHFQDRTEVRARNIVWRGEWPTEIPPAFGQKLASRELQFLDDGLPELKQVFEHDFTEREPLFDRFDVAFGEPADFEQQPDGVHATTPFGNTYRNSSLAPRLRLSGDFDITAHFDGLDLNARKGGTCGVFLQAAVENETAQQFRVYRRLEHFRERPRDVLKCVAIEQRGKKPSYTTFEMVVDETPSGTLRLSRRGRKVYLLFAQGESPNFRLLGVHETTTDDIHDIQIGSQSQNQSVTQVVWKRLMIRANAIESEEELVTDLNAARDRLPQKFQYTFDNTPIPPELFELSGTLVPEEDALRMENLGTAAWSASRLRPRFGLQGDFDIEINVADVKFVTPVVRRGSAFYFQFKYSEHHTELICGKDSEGRNMVYVQEQGILFDRVILQNGNHLDALRIARRGKAIYFLYRLKGSPQDRLLTSKELTDQPILPGDIYLMLSSGKPGELSSVKLKSFQFRAETLFPDPNGLQQQRDGD